MATNSKKTEALIGSFLLLGLILLGGLIVMFGQIGDLIEERYPMSVDFKDASGLIEGSTVRFRGAPVGRVAAPPALTDDWMIRVPLEIEERFQIPLGSTFGIGQASLLGDKEIIITPPDSPTETYLLSGAEVMGSASGGLDQLQRDVEDIAQDAKALVTDARDTLGTVDESVKDIQGLLELLMTSVSKLNLDILSPENTQNLSRTLANLTRASESFAELGEDLDPTVRDLRSTLAKFRQAALQTQSTIAKVEPSLEGIPDVLSSLERTANTATATLDEVKNGNGVLKSLTTDKSLDNDVKDFVRNLKKNGILRYKDEDEKPEDPRDRFQGRRR